MKVKDIHNVLGVSPATFFDWSKETHSKNTLAQLLKKLELQDVLELLQQKDKKPQKPMMLLSTVNCSIGNKEKHFTLTGLKKLFYKKDELNIYDKYVLKTIKNEATQIEVDEFVNYYKIPKIRVQQVLVA